MTNEEASKIVSKLVALFPNTSVGETTVATWIGYLMPLQADIMREAVNNYALLPGKKFFPTPGEILEIYDLIYQDYVAKKIAAHQEAEREATRLLFHKPINQFHNDHVRQSVQLIRDVCAGEIKYRSKEWEKRFREIYPGFEEKERLSA